MTACMDLDAVAERIAGAVACEHGNGECAEQWSAILAVARGPERPARADMRDFAAMCYRYAAAALDVPTPAWLREW